MYIYIDILIHVIFLLCLSCQLGPLCLSCQLLAHAVPVVPGGYKDTHFVGNSLPTANTTIHAVNS